MPEPPGASLVEVGRNRRDHRERGGVGAALPPGRDSRAGARPPARPAAPRASPDDPLEALRVHRREAQALSRAGEPLEVLFEPERPTAVDADRLERGPPAQEALRRRRGAPARSGRRARARRPPGRGRSCSDRHRRLELPTAARRGRALTQDSSISARGSESQTMPPPTQRWISPSATANVRIVSASSRSPFGWIRPERSHRGAAADRLERGDVVDGGDLGRAGDRAAREDRA